MPVLSQNADSLYAMNAVAGTAITWFYNNALIANAANPTIHIGQLGNYHACYTNSDGCQVCAPDFNVTVLTTENEFASQIQLAPNPASTYAALNGLPETGCTIRVFNTLGQIIETFESRERAENLDITTWSSGIYRILITTPNSNSNSNSNSKTTILNLVKE